MEDYSSIIEQSIDQMTIEQLKSVILNAYQRIYSFGVIFQEYDVSGTYILASNIIRNECIKEYEDLKSENLIDSALFEKIKSL